MAEHGLSSSQLSLEITETTMFPRHEPTVDDLTELTLAPGEQVLEKIHHLGIRIVVDDFGTGYGSLLYLSRLPVDAFKIDKSFVHGIHKNPHDAIIVTSLIHLAKNLGLDVIAEGIESHEHVMFLRMNDCLYGQGFQLCKPLTATEMGIFLAER
jgi:EAL domain-containing protein (putative c-di-GMP-specific phosphodiesterase class I)